MFLITAGVTDRFCVAEGGAVVVATVVEVTVVVVVAEGEPQAASSSALLRTQKPTKSVRFINAPRLDVWSKV
jgi:hypothetical protein